jgi:antibiotic biosynthesis monooxygenase (ABM) superfamily enzyme
VIIGAVTTNTEHPKTTAAAMVKLAKQRKLWILLSLGIYPIITTVETVGDPILRHLTRYGQFALVVPVMVAVMVWVVIPLLHRYFGAWMAR